MNGRTLYRMVWSFVFLVAGASGCADSRAAPPGPAVSGFDPESAGCIEGRVVWSGDLPAVAPFAYRVPDSLGADPVLARLCANPFAPAIDPSSRGVDNAVVFLRGVDPHKARRWDQPRVAVEQRDLQLHVRQGSRDGRIGFVHRGDPVDMVSREPRLHALRAQGAAWFTLAFPDADQRLARPFDQCGVVELTSGAGYYWMRAYLLVDDHPYYTVTDANGRFALPLVPPGRYEIVCWLPSWRETGHDRDPDTGLVTRLRFAVPMTSKQAVEIGPRRKCEVRLEISAGDLR